MRIKTLKKISLAVICTGLAFIIIFFTITQTHGLIGVAVPKEDIPYVPPAEYPDDTTVLFKFSSGYGIALRLEFENRFISAVILENATEEAAMVYGFKIEETAECDYRFILDFIDCLDGVEMLENGQIYRYTGVQICNILAAENSNIKVKCAVLEAVFKKIYKIGFSSDALSCIMNDTTTTLSVPDCYGWCENVGALCARYNIINKE